MLGFLVNFRAFLCSLNFRIFGKNRRRNQFVFQEFLLFFGQPGVWLGCLVLYTVGYGLRVTSER
jgi:hypothetical protein